MYQMVSGHKIYLFLVNLKNWIFAERCNISLSGGVCLHNRNETLAQTYIDMTL